MKKKGTNKIDETLGCIMTVKRSFPSSLNNEACGRYLTKEEMDEMEKKIAVHDFYPVVAKNKETFDADMDKFAQDELKISRDEFDLLCGLLYLCKVSYFNLLNDGVPCPTVCASSTVDNKLLVTATTANRGPTVTDTMIDCGELSHPECYCAGWIGNLLIFPPKRLDAQCRTIKLAYSYVCNTPLVTRISYRFAGHDDKSAEELELFADAIRASCIKGGRASGSMRIEASEFINECVKSGMSRSDAIELLRSIDTKLASLFEGSVKGGEKTGSMISDAADFVREVVNSDVGMNREDTIELLRSINTKLANLYEGSFKTDKLRRIAAGKDMTEYVWECCCKEKRQGYIDTTQMWCETCQMFRNTTNRNPDGELVWRLPAVHHDEQEKARQLSAQQPKAIAKARENAAQAEKRRKEVSTKYKGVQNANKMKPPPPPPKS